MGTEQKDHLDYAKVGDTGQDNIDAIVPISDGEPATQTVLRRPSENLRERTEDLRQFVEDTAYYRDAQHIVLSSPGTITWEGTVANGGTGKIVQSDVITIKPFLTPRADTKASISIGVAAINEIMYTISASGFSTQRMNQVYIEHLDGGVAAVLTAIISDGPVKRIKVVFDGANILHDAAAVKSIVDAAIAGDADLSGKITTAINALPLAFVAAQTETRFEGIAEPEEHRIAAGVLDALTTTNPLQAGDTVAIWYRYLVDPLGGFDGRRESTNTHGTTNIPLASLFITSLEPDKIPGAIPLCTVTGNTVNPGVQLVFIDGTVFNKDDVFMFGSTSAASIAYDGGPTWADLSTNPVTTVEGQLDKIISDLGQGVSGTAKVSSDALVASAPGNDAIGAAALFTQLQILLDLINDRADLTDNITQSFAGPLELTDAVLLKHADVPLGVNPRVINDEVTIANYILLFESKALSGPNRYIRLYSSQKTGQAGFTFTYNAKWNGTVWIPDSTATNASRWAWYTSASVPAAYCANIPAVTPASITDAEWFDPEAVSIDALAAYSPTGVIVASKSSTFPLFFTLYSAADDPAGNNLKLIQEFKNIGNEYTRIYMGNGAGTSLYQGLVITCNAKWVPGTALWTADNIAKAAVRLQLGGAATGLTGNLDINSKADTSGTTWADTAWDVTINGTSPTLFGGVRINGLVTLAQARQRKFRLGGIFHAVPDTAGAGWVLNYNLGQWTSGGAGKLAIPLYLPERAKFVTVKVYAFTKVGDTVKVYKTDAAFPAAFAPTPLGGIATGTGILETLLVTTSEAADVSDKTFWIEYNSAAGGGNFIQDIEITVEYSEYPEQIVPV